jgi:hypothetical protein
MNIINLLTYLPQSLLVTPSYSYSELWNFEWKLWNYELWKVEASLTSHVILMDHCRLMDGPNFWSRSCHNEPLENYSG